MATAGSWGREPLLDGDELLDEIEPIYIRSSELRQYRQVYDVEEEDLSSGDELADEQVNLDLTAPPSESWFHGRVSRQMACERLDMVGEPGGYLVRESVQQPGDYAISYLSRTGQVHHFKINSNCGDYYIGGRQFFSLGDLIGFYANCSCILENESLEVPIVPPKPIPLYLMVKATQAHMKTPGTDELSIESGEVFTLLTTLNCDWGWGRSQRTGESGLIPIVIMEDITEEDHNLGKPWFHGSISRDDAVDLLLRSGVIGSFLIRLSAKMGDEARYSLAVRTPDRVQRFQILKYVTGYYVFGGRPFNSIEDVIERYRNEVILDGLKLGDPVIKEVQPTTPRQKPANIEPPPSRHRSDSKSIERAHMPGDKSGRLMLRKGKKCPVYGKWKEFYFVVKSAEKKLLYYDQESSHRARGLLDLKQCRVFYVHPSLYGKSDCIVVMLRYLNELSFYYMSTGTVEEAQEWLRLLRHCMSPDSDAGPDKEPGVQQIRSLSLSIKDCKLAKTTSQIYTLLSFDGAAIARTRVAADVPCVFDENFLFEDLPPSAQTFTAEVHTTRGKKLSMISGRDTTGRVHIHLSDLPNGQEDDQWHHLLATGAKTAKGSLRIVANFKDQIILPLDEYRKLKQLLLSDDLTTIETLAKVCKDHHAELASTLIHIFIDYDRVVPIITACLGKSIESEENMSTLFRGSTLSTMLMDQLMKLTASDYLLSVLKGPVQQILDSQESCEVNPSLLPKGAELSHNLDRLENHLQHILTSIFISTDSCPVTLRFIFRSLQEKVVQKWPTDESVRTIAVSGFLFLRFICPALLKPQLFNLISEPPTIMADRTLKLLTKAIQNLANLMEFKTKEPFMTSLNPFITRFLPRMRQFVDDIANYGSELHSVTLESVDSARDLATIYHLCCTYEKNLQKTGDIQLKGVIQSLKSSEKKYVSNKFS